MTNSKSNPKGKHKLKNKQTKERCSKWPATLKKKKKDKYEQHSWSDKTRHRWKGKEREREKKRERTAVSRSPDKVKEWCRRCWNTKWFCKIVKANSGQDAKVRSIATSIDVPTWFICFDTVKWFTLMNKKNERCANADYDGQIEKESVDDKVDGMKK